MAHSSRSFQELAFPSSTSTLRGRIPTTPIRRFLCRADLMRPFLALGKRSREDVSIAGDATTRATEAIPTDFVVSASRDIAMLAAMSNYVPVRLSEAIPTASPSSPLHTVAQSFLDHPATDSPLAPSVSRQAQAQAAPRARVAIQQHDRPLDAIVITTLPSFPFCCHEDPLTMSREQLVRVAELFNDHLPSGSASTAAQRIDTSEERSEAYIRHCIEVLCGIVPEEVPAAPKAVRSRAVVLDGSQAPLQQPHAGVGNLWLRGREMDALKPEGGLFLARSSPPTSPLAMRLPASRRRGIGMGPSLLSSPSGLERLEEEDYDEGDVFDNHRALKRRKLSISEENENVAPRRTFYSRGHGLATQDTELSTPSRRARSRLTFTTHRPADLLLPFHDESSSSDVDIDMALQSPSPLQHRSRTFGLHIPPLAPKPKLYRSKSKSVRRSASKRAQQICRPMGNLCMNSDPAPVIRF
ncbi:hypothetical protein CVT26_013556 [Gymnopilus dilepis]|uniref:Uncharacterized protein n=1 Tax=Gymnopilus dilepis TaxID=231916 RepID=A0A409YX10_9AGAR|nr:hypothetical protein CVT26_013556 [Gymnopilus dilepis]